ncbi:hypothetical protein Tco_0172412, partial [Tanacetum coccineum]
SKVVDESDSTIPDPSHQTVTSTPPVIAPVLDFPSLKPSSLVTPLPINTEATTITTSLPEITPFIALHLRVARLEQDMSKVKKTDRSAAVLASIKSQVPTVVDKYLGTKLDDALLRVLEQHTADLIEKYFVLSGPESIKNQESTKSSKEIIKIKREQGLKTQRKHDSDEDEDDDDKEALLRIKTRGINNLEDTDNAHIPKVTATTWFKPIPEDERPATPELEWTIPPNDFPEPENNWANAYATTLASSAETSFKGRRNDIVPSSNGSAVEQERRSYAKLIWKMDECHKLLTNKVDLVNPEGHQILRNIYEPLPLGGPPGQCSLWSSHTVVQKKAILPNKHSEPSDREAVRSQMRILSVIRVKTFEKYGYNYLREIILRRADYKEYKISEKDFKNLHPNDFEDQHLSKTKVFHNEDGNPVRANIKQALGRPHKGVKASANSGVMYFFTSAQDGDPSQDDVRLCLGNVLKKAQDHSQRQA